MKFSSIGWIGIITIDTTVRAQFTKESLVVSDALSHATTTSPPERWLRLCGGLFGRNKDEPCKQDICADYEEQIDALVSELISGRTCSCNPCPNPFDILIDCNLCSACSEEKDLCIDATLTAGIIVKNTDSLAPVSSKYTVKTRGADSASNTVSVELMITDGVFSSCRATLNGFACTACSGVVNLDCFVVDCSNVAANGSRWTCEDSSTILADTSHPFFGFYKVFYDSCEAI